MTELKRMQQREVDRRINAFCQTLTVGDRVEGIKWWDRAYDVMEGIIDSSRLVNPYPTLEKVAAATAILSPLQPWDRNVRMVEELAKDKWLDPLTFYKWWNKAQLALWTDDPPLNELATGIKVNPFWRALCGERDAVVVDRWILRIAYPDDRGYPARVRRITNSIRRLASGFGLSPRDLQSAMWVKVRGR